MGLAEQLTRAENIRDNFGVGGRKRLLKALWGGSQKPCGADPVDRGLITVDDAPPAVGSPSAPSSPSHREQPPRAAC